jgi:pimeloyl-ACP methyl ester carboxylesterase
MVGQRAVRTPAGTLAVQAAGDGPAVLLVHGIPGSSDVWAEVSEGLVDAGFRVLAPDLLGFGASDRPVALDELWVGAQATALAHVLETLEAAPAIIVGHDYGAPTSVVLAGRQPGRVSSLLLAAGNLFTDTPIPVPLNTLTWPLIGGLAGSIALSTPMLRIVLRIGVGRPALRLDPDVYLGDPDQQRSIRTIFSGALQGLADRYSEVETELATLQMPTAVLWGGRDPFLGVDQAELAASAIPGATLRIEPGAGHFLPAERPTSFIDLARQLHTAATPTTPP